MKINLIPQAHAAPLPLGPITGTGTFQQYSTTASTNVSLLEDLISKVIGIITIMAGVSFLVFFVISSLNWITAGGDKAKVEKAQQSITNSLVGLVLTILAYFILGILSTVLDIPFLDLNSII